MVGGVGEYLRISNAAFIRLWFHFTKLVLK